MLRFEQVGDSPRYRVIRDNLIIGRILFNMETREWIFDIPICSDEAIRARTISLTELKAIITFAECLEKPKE